MIVYQISIKLEELEMLRRNIVNIYIVLKISNYINDFIFKQSQDRKSIHIISVCIRETKYRTLSPELKTINLILPF
jgi:hypothetical protein